MTTQLLWINISLMAVFFGLITGIPMWMVLRRPDKDPAETRAVPDYLKYDWEHLPTPAGRR